MWRSVGRKCTRCWKLESQCRTKRCTQKCLIQFYSSQPPSSSGSGGKIVIGIAGASILIGGCSVLAAKFIPGFRSQLEGNVPYSGIVLTAILGESEKDIKLNTLSKRSQEISPNRSAKQQTELPSLSKKNATPTAAPSPELVKPEITSKESKLETKSLEKAPQQQIDKSQPSTDRVLPPSSSTDVLVDPTSTTISDMVEAINKQENTDKQKETTAQQPISEKLHSQIDLELKRQEQEIDKLYKEKKEYKEELLKQLRRQAEFHSEYLRALLQAQRNELKSEFEDLYQDKIIEAKHEVQEELASQFAQLTGVKDELNQYVETHKEWIKAKKLWVACWALKHRCDPVNPAANERQPLAPVIEVLTSLAGSDDQFTNLVVGAIPAEAINLGVYSKEALMERFFKLDTMCRRVVLIGDSGGSLFKYATSYLQSLLVGSRDLFRTMNANDEPVDVSKHDMFEILDHAKWYILQGNLENAVRYVNLLHGTPRKVASDWLKDARMYLEVRQVADVLIARSGATDAHSF